MDYNDDTKETRFSILESYLVLLIAIRRNDTELKSVAATTKWILAENDTYSSLEDWAEDTGTDLYSMTAEQCIENMEHHMAGTGMIPFCNE